MRVILFTFFLIFLTVGSKAADLYTSIKSSLFETISDGFNVQLIDANIPGYHLLIQVKSQDDLIADLQELELYLTQLGYQVSLSQNSSDYYLLVKLPKDNVDSTLKQFLSKLEGRFLNNLELIILGSINQQRLLGVINRLFKSADISLEASDESNSVEFAITLPSSAASSVNASKEDWRLALATGLLSCDYLVNGVVRFNYYLESLSCNSYLPNSFLTDKEVANLKDRLYSDIQLSIETPAGFIQYISSFQSERRLEESQAFFTHLPNLSIDSILAYHYKILLNVQDDASSSLASVKKLTSYQLPNNYKIKSTYTSTSSKVVNLNIAINNSHTCIQINCQSLNSLQYIEYTKSEDMHNFAIQYPSVHETSVIDELKKVLFIPLSTSRQIAQEDILLSLTGGYLLEAYDESFKLLANLPIVKEALSNKNGFELSHLNFYLNQDGVTQITLGSVAVPGAEFWEESELLYFILANELKKLEPAIEIVKANTLVHLHIREKTYLELDGSPIIIVHSSSEKDDSERMIEGFAERLAFMLNQLSRDQFVAYKNGLMTNLSLLQDEQVAVRYVAQLFDLKLITSLLQSRVESLSYEQFQAYLKSTIPYAPIKVSTNHDLGNDFERRIRKLLDF